MARAWVYGHSSTRPNGPAPGGVNRTLSAAGGNRLITAGNTDKLTAKLMNMPAPEITPSSAMPVNGVGTKPKKPMAVVAVHTSMKLPTSAAARGSASGCATPSPSSSRYCMHRYSA